MRNGLHERDDLRHLIIGKGYAQAVGRILHRILDVTFVRQPVLDHILLDIVHQLRGLFLADRVCQVAGGDEFFHRGFFLIFAQFFSAGGLIGHHDACQGAGARDFNGRGGHNVAIFHSGCEERAGDHGTGDKGQIGDLHLDSAAVGRLHIGTTVGAGPDLGFCGDAFHIFPLVRVGNFNGLYLVGRGPKILVHGILLIFREISPQSHHLGAVCLSGHGEADAGERHDQYKRYYFLKFFHKTGEPPFLLYFLIFDRRGHIPADQRYVLNIS